MSLLAPSDFVARAGVVVNFEPFEMRRTVDVQLRDDEILENEEEFRGVLSLVPGGAGGRVRLGVDSATGIIEDDDSKLEFTLKVVLSNCPASAYKMGGEHAASRNIPSFGISKLCCQMEIKNCDFTDMDQAGVNSHFQHTGNEIGAKSQYHCGQF